MSLNARRFITKIFAIITLTAFCATQTIWAAPYARNLRQTSDAVGRASGIGQALLATSNSAGATFQDKYILISQNPPQNIASNDAVTKLLIAYLKNRSRKDTSQIPAAFSEIVTDILAFARLTPVKRQEGLINNIPPKTDVSRSLDQLKNMAPTLDDKNCAAFAMDNIFSAGEFGLPEHAQSENFNQMELFVAMATAADIIATGGIHTTEISVDGAVKYRTLKNSLFSVVSTLQALGAYDNENRQWQAVNMTAKEVETAVSNGRTVLAVSEKNHIKLVGSSDSITKPTLAITDWQPKRAKKTVPLDKLLKTTVGCGAYEAIVRSKGIAATLLALLKFEYRGRDNAGLLWLDENGPQRWISIGPGAVRNLVRGIYTGSIFTSGARVEEPYQFGTQEHVLVTKRTRMVNRQGFSLPEYRDLSSTHYDHLFTLDSDGNPIQPERRIALTLGDKGSMHAGDQYIIDEEMNVINRVSKDYGITVDIVKMFVRFELEKLLENKTEHPILRAYDQLIEKARSGALNEDIELEITEGKRVGEKIAWAMVWGKFDKKYRLITVPPMFNNNILWQAFRMQGAIIGTFRLHPEWQAEVEAIFNRRVGKANKEGQPPLDWRECWFEEKNTIMAGHAFEAFNEWMHMHFYKMKRIHPDVWEKEGLEAAYKSLKIIGGTNQDERKVGAFDWILAELLGDSVLGHGRWGMSGGIFIEYIDSGGTTKRDAAPAHPHSDPDRIHFSTHNGQIDAERYEIIKAEHEAQNIEYISEKGLAIATDTRQIPNHWYYLGKAFGTYYDIWKENPSAQTLHAKAGLPMELAERNHQRFKKWNKIVVNLLESQGISNDDAIKLVRGSASWEEMAKKSNEAGLILPLPDEVAHRLSSLELAQGSTQMGVTNYSAYDPFTHRAVSHKRPIAIDIWNDMATIGSDDVAGLSLFPSSKTDEAARQIRQQREQVVEAVSEFNKNVKDNPDRDKGEITLIEFYKKALEIYEDSVKKIAEIEAPFTLDVVYLNGPDNYAEVWKEIDKDGKPAQRWEITTFEGHKKDIKPQKKVISPAIADKGNFTTFMDSHFHAVPWVALKVLLSYMSIKDAQSIEKIKPSIGSDPATRNKQTPGIHWDFLEQQFGRMLENLDRLIMLGVGSAEYNIQITKVLAETILPPSVDVEAFESASVSVLISEGALTATSKDEWLANSYSGTTAAVENPFNHANDNGAALIANTGQLSHLIPQIAQETGGAIDVLVEEERTTATYLAFLMQNLTLFIFLLEKARRMGVPEEYLAPYILDILKVPQLLTEETYSTGYRAKADQTANEMRTHNKSIVIGSPNNPFIKEVGIKDAEILWRPSNVFHFDGDWETPLRSAARDGKTTVYIWATDPESLDEARETVVYAKRLGLKPVVVTIKEDNPYLEEMNEATPFLFISPKLIGILQALADNPICMHLVRALLRVKGRTDEEIDFLRNLAKSVVVFSFDYNLAKEVTDTELFIAEWEERVRNSGLDVEWQVYKAWRQQGTETSAAAAGVKMNRSPQLEAIADLPVLADNILKELFDPNGRLATAVSENIKTKFGQNAERLKRIVIVTNQDPLINAAEETRLDYPQLLEFQVNQIKIVSPAYKNYQRYMNGDDTLVIFLSQSQRDISDRRVSTADAVIPLAPFKTEAKIIEAAKSVQEKGVSVLTISDEASGLMPIGEKGIGNIVWPKDVKDTSLKMAADLCLDSLGIQLSRIKFESGTRRNKIDNEAQALMVLPSFMMDRIILNDSLLSEIREAAGAVARYDKSLFTAGGQAEKSAKDASRGLSLYEGNFAKFEPAHSMLHGPLTGAKPEPSKFLTLDDGTIVIRPDADIDDDTVFVVFANGNESMSTDDMRTIVTRYGVVIALLNQRLVDALDKATPKNLGALRVIRVPDVPPLLIKYIDHCTGNLFAYEMASHHGIYQQVEARLKTEEGFNRFINDIVRLINTFQSTQDPQFMPMENPDNPNESYLLLVCQDRPGLSGAVNTFLGTQEVNIKESISPDIPGFPGLMLLRVDHPVNTDPQTGYRGITELREGILSIMTVPKAITFPSVSEPTPAQRLDKRSFSLRSVLKTLGGFTHESGLFGAAIKEGIVGPYAQLQPAQRQRLEELAAYAENIWLPKATNTMARLHPELRYSGVYGRMATLFVTDETTGKTRRIPALMNFLDNIKDVLLGGHGQAAEDSAALSYAVVGEGLNDIGKPNLIPKDLYALVISGWGLPEEAAEFFKDLNPLMSISDLEQFLQKLTDINNGAAPNVVHLRNREREHVYAEKFAELAKDGKIQRDITPQDGTVEWGIVANLPSGGTLMLTTAKLPQAVATVAFSKAMPKGAFAALRVLPGADVINSEAYISQATPKNPIGGHNAWTDEQRENIEKWVGKRMAQEILAGRPITTFDIKGPISGFVIPQTEVTSMPVAVKGVRIKPETNEVMSSTILIQDGKIWVQPASLPVTPLPERLRFAPPPDGGLAAEPLTLVATTLAVNAAAEIATFQDLPNEITEQLHAIVKAAQTHRANAASDTRPEDTIKSFYDILRQRIVETAGILRTQYPKLPIDMPLEVRTDGGALSWYSDDGTSVLNVNVFRHPLLTFQFAEYAVLHRLLNDITKEEKWKLPDALMKVGAREDKMKAVLIEMACTGIMAGRFLSYKEKQEKILDALQKLEDIGSTHQLIQLLETLRLVPEEGDTWAGSLLDYVSKTQPGLAETAKLLLETFKKQHAVVGRPYATLRRVIEGRRSYHIVDISPEGAITATPEISGDGLREIEKFLSFLKEETPILYDHVEQAYQGFRDTTTPKFEAFSDPYDANRTVIVLAQYDHPALDQRVIDPVSGKNINFELTSSKVIKAVELLRPVAVGIFVIESDYAALEGFGIIADIRKGLQHIADLEEQEWQERSHTHADYVISPAAAAGKAAGLQQIYNRNAGRLGLVERVGRFACTEHGGYVEIGLLDSIPDKIEIGRGTVITGEASDFIAAGGSSLIGAYLSDVKVNGKTEIWDSILQTEWPDEEGRWDNWAYKDAEGNKVYTVSGQQTTVAKDSYISKGAVVTNLGIGENATILGGQLSNGNIENSALIQDVKGDLISVSEGVNMSGPTEVAEGWFLPGFRLDTEAYLEGVFNNSSTTLVFGDAGNPVGTKEWGIPAIMKFGRSVIYSSYDGKLNAKGKQEIKEITGSESSRHYNYLTEPLALLGESAVVIGMPGWPDKLENVYDSNNMTHITAESFVGMLDSEVIEGLRKRPETWARVYGKKTGLSPRADNLAWMLTYAPVVFSEMVNEALGALAAMDEPRLAMDGYLEALIRTKLYEAQNNPVLAKYPDMRDKGVELYKKHLESGLWKIKDGILAFGINKFNPADFGLPADYKQPTIDDLFGPRLYSGERYSSPLYDDWASLPNGPRARWVSYKHAYRQIGEGTVVAQQGNVVIGPNVKIGKNVTIMAGVKLTGKTVIEDGAVIMPGTKLHDSVVEKNATVWATSARNAIIMEGSKVMLSILDGGKEGIVIGPSADIKSSKLVAKTKIVRLGKKASSVQAYIEDSEIGDGSKIFAFAKVVRTKLGRKAKLGSICYDSNLGDGFVSQHTNTRIYNLYANNLGGLMPLSGLSTNVTNIGAGTIIGEPDSQLPVVIFEGSVFVGSNSRIEGGAQVGHCAFVKGTVKAGEVINPFAFRSDDEYVEKGIFTKLGFPFYARHWLSKAVAAIRSETNEQDSLNMLAASNNNALRQWTSEQLHSYSVRPTADNNLEFTYGKWIEQGPVGSDKWEFEETKASAEGKNALRQTEARVNEAERALKTARSIYSGLSSKLKKDPTNTKLDEQVKEAYEVMRVAETSLNEANIALGAIRARAKAGADSNVLQLSAEDIRVQINSEGKTAVVIDENRQRRDIIIQALVLSDIFKFKEVIGAVSLDEAQQMKLDETADFVIDLTSKDIHSLHIEVFETQLANDNIKVGLKELDVNKAIEEINSWLYTQL